MKRRVRRAVIGAAVFVAGVVGVFVVAHWGAVRDHVEAWHFQLTTETEMIKPPCHKCEVESAGSYQIDELYIVYGHVRDVAHALSCPVIVDLGDWPWWDLPPLSSVLVKDGWRILEQRFPRRAFVVIRAAEVIADAPIVETFVIPSARSRVNQ